MLENGTVAPYVRVHPLRRWFAFLGGGVCWTLHLLSIYAIGEFGCVSGLGRVMYQDISLVSWMILCVSIVLLAVTATAAVISYLDMRRDSRDNAAAVEEEGGIYLSKFGFILNVVFAVIIVVETLPVFAYLHGC